MVTLEGSYSSEYNLYFSFCNYLFYFILFNYGFALRFKLFIKLKLITLRPVCMIVIKSNVSVKYEVIHNISTFDFIVFSKIVDKSKKYITLLCSQGIFLMR